MICNNYFLIYSDCNIIPNGHWITGREFGITVEHTVLGLLLGLLLQVDRVRRNLGGSEASGFVQDHRVAQGDCLQVAFENNILVYDEPLGAVPDVLGLDERRVQVRDTAALCAYEISLGLS